MAKDMTVDEVRKMAEEIGIERLSDEHLQQLLRSTNAARKRRASLRIDALDTSDEPAHVLRLGPERMQ